MEPERWERIERLYHHALELEPERRHAFIAASCEDDQGLCHDVESLIALDEEAAGFLEYPALQVLAAALAHEETRRTPFRLGRYDVLAPLGTGGMGRVFRARDRQLQRQVALKLLPDHLAADPVARKRFRREAISAAALDHPFICKVYEISEHDNALVIAMEMVHGETLADRLRRGPPDLADGLRIAGEIAEALDAAHARGIAHRDLKPGNVMLTTGGRVKVMDFGIAKRVIAHDAAKGTPTPARLTAASAILGTPVYMSPEQIAGEQVDGRTDVFSFGIVLCELVTGAHPFRRTTAEATMAAILYEPPQLPSTGPGGSAPLAAIIRRLLAKNRAERYQAITDAWRDLQRVLSSVEPNRGVAAPASPPRGGRSPLVGRDCEYRELLGRLEAATAGAGSFVLLSGEPGIGKTRLTQDVVTVARQRGYLALIGHCREGEGAPSYGPFVEMFEELAESFPPERLQDVIGESAPDITKLMPDVARRFKAPVAAADTPPQQQRRVFFNAFRDVIRRLGRLTPLVFILEDLHWADEPTLLLVQHLAEGAESLPLLMIGTYRDVELDVARPFVRTLEGLVRERLADRVVLRRLSFEAVESLLAALSGQSPPERLTRAVHQQTEGNPFFVEEVFQHLAEEGKLFTADGTWQSNLRVSDVHVPEGVRLVLRRRLERLTLATSRVLTTAAIVGRSFDLRLLESLSVDGPDAVTEAIEEAEAARLVAPEEAGREPRYRFVHELIRQTMVEAVSLPRRQRLHAQVADAIERLHAGRIGHHVPALAHHLLQAGAAADQERTRAFVIQAAEQAHRAAAYEEALVYFDAALALLEDEAGEGAADLHVRRADVLRSLGKFDSAVAAYDRAIDLYDATGNSVKLASATFPLTLIHAWNADGPRHLAATSRALDRLPDTAPALRCHILFLHALGLTTCGDAAGGLTFLEDALALKAGIDQPSLDKVGTILEAHVRYQAMQIPQASEASRRAMVLCAAVRDLWGYVDMEWHQVMAAVYLARPNAARRMIEEARPQAERVGHHNVIWFYRLLGASLELADGNLEAAERKAFEALALGDQYRIRWNFSSELMLGQIAFYRGHTRAALGHYRRAVEREPASYWSGLSRSALFAALAQEGDPSASSVLREPPIRRPSPYEPQSFGAWVSLTHLVEGFAWMDRRADAAALHPACEALVSTGVRCFRDFRLYCTAAGIAAACAGEWTRAEDHFGTAMHEADTAPLPVAAAHARYWYGALLQERSDGRGRDLLLDARSRFDHLGMPGFVAKADAALTGRPRGS